MEEINKKRCSKCKEIKDVINFQKNRRFKSGLSCSCKSCINKRNKLEHRKAYQKDYQKKHKEIYKLKRYSTRNQQKYRDILSDSYIIELLNNSTHIPISEIKEHHELIRIKRIEIEALRQAKKERLTLNK